MKKCKLSSLILSYLDEGLSELEDSSSTISQTELVFSAVVDVLTRCTEFPAALGHALIPLTQRFVILMLSFHCVNLSSLW